MSEDKSSLDGQKIYNKNNALKLLSYLDVLSQN